MKTTAWAVRESGDIMNKTTISDLRNSVTDELVVLSIQIRNSFQCVGMYVCV